MMRSILPARAARATRTELLLLGLLTAAAAAVRLSLWWTQSIVSVDGTEYIRLAQQMAGAPFRESAQPYGYPFLILLVHAFGTDWVSAARVAAFIPGIALVPLTWQLSRYFVPVSWLRLLPAAAVAFLPLTVRYSLTTMSEAPYLAALLAMFIFASGRRGVLAGLAAGVAYAIRPEALTAAAVLALLLLPDRRVLVRFVAATAVVVAGYVLVQGVQRGVWTLSQKTVDIAGTEWWEREPTVGAAPTDVSLEGRLRENAGSMVRGYPGRFLALGGHLLSFGGFAAPVVALAGLASGGLLLAAGLVQFLVTPLFGLGGNPRFILPFLPFLWILAAAAAARSPRVPLRIALAAVLVAGFAGSAMQHRLAYRVNEDGVYPELKEAGEWLRQYATPATVVYDRKPYTAFYAGASYREIPLGTYDQVLNEIVAKGGDYLVVHQQVTRFFRPALLPLIEDKPVVWNEPRLRPVYFQDRYMDGRTLIYRVVRPGGPPPVPGEEKLKEAIGVIPHSNNHFLHGMLAMRAERWAAAAGEFAYVIRDEPENSVALNNRAWCLLKDGHFLDLAEGASREAVRLEPENTDYLDTLVEILRATGRDRAADYWQERIGEIERKRAEPGYTGEAKEPPEGDRAPGSGQ